MTLYLIVIAIVKPVAANQNHHGLVNSLPVMVIHHESSNTIIHLLVSVLSKSDVAVRRAEHIKHQHAVKHNETILCDGRIIYGSSNQQPGIISYPMDLTQEIHACCQGACDNSISRFTHNVVQEHHAKNIQCSWECS